MGIGLPGAGPAAATMAVDSKATHVCRFPAYLTDKDPAGTNIRAAPRADAPIVARLPGRKGDIGPELEIIGSRGGWFLMHNAAGGILPTSPRRCGSLPGRDGYRPPLSGSRPRTGSCGDTPFWRPRG